MAYDQSELPHIGPTRREARAMKLGKAAMAAGIYGMLTAGKK